MSEELQVLDTETAEAVEHINENFTQVKDPEISAKIFDQIKEKIDERVEQVEAEGDTYNPTTFTVVDESLPKTEINITMPESREKTRSTNNQLQGPETEELNYNEKYWTTEFNSDTQKWSIYINAWHGTTIEKTWLKEGEIFKTKEAAEKWIKAKNEG